MVTLIHPVEGGLILATVKSFKHIPRRRKGSQHSFLES